MYEKKYPEVIKPIKIGNDKTLKYNQKIKLHSTKLRSYPYIIYN